VSQTLSPSTADTLVEARGLTKHFPIRKGILRRIHAYARAVDGVSFEIVPGQTLGLVGESGSGKSTLGRCVLRLLKIDDGELRIAGQDITKVSRRQLRIVRRNAQMIFQDPYSSFDPRSTVGSSITEPLRAHEHMNRRERDDRAAELVSLVGLGRPHLERYPYQFSGGQLQRLAIARALAINPQLVVCDEPVSSLDVSTQAQVINLMRRLQDELGVAYLFIAHDLSVVRHVSNDIAVMYLGRIVEQGPAEAVYSTPKHPYTEALLSAVPVPGIVLYVDPRLRYTDPDPAVAGAEVDAWYRAMAAMYPKSPIEIVPNTSHFIQFDQPDLVLARLRTLLAEVRPT